MIINIFIILAIGLSTVAGTSPDQFSWDNYNNTSFLGTVSNQNFPNVCNSGWAFSAIDVLNSRMKIRRKAASPDISLSVQVLLSCDTLDFGCLGGEPLTAFKWISKNNITDQTCHSYTGKGYTNGQTCDSISKCQSCADGKCKSVANSKIYAIHKYGSVSGQEDMMAEIERYGPISCGMSSANLSNYTPNTMINNNGSKKVDHFVTVFGWGQFQGLKYWIARNSYGPSWGNSGNFLIQRGQNTLGIQSRCMWAALTDTWTNDVRNKTLPGGSQIKTKPLSIPSSYSYNIGNFLAPSMSYLTPNSCKTAWAFSVIQMLADRQNKNSNGTRPIKLSVQALLNCGIGTCQKGGSPHDALLFIQKYGLPEQGCQTYQAKTPAKQNCNNINNCATCSGTIYNFTCVERKYFKRWRIYDFGSLSGVQNMKTQIFAWGPIICGIHASKQFQQYKGGIFSEVSISPKINHYVEVLGWGEENNKSYWIGRNIWGTSWGQSSFFRIQMGSNNLGIESKCYFGNTLM